MPAIRFYYSDTIHDFLDRCTDEIIGKMVQASAHDLNDETTDSWVCEIEVLKDVLALYRDRGSVFFEYNIPRMGRRADVMALIAKGLNVPAAKVYGVATFYAHFTLEPKGKHIIRCCDGTACHVKGSTAIMDALRADLGLTENQRTTKDGNFTLEIVSCLGACGLAPVVVLDEHVHGQCNSKEAVEIIKAVAQEN